MKNHFNVGDLVIFSSKFGEKEICYFGVICGYHNLQIDNHLFPQEEKYIDITWLDGDYTNVAMRYAENYVISHMQVLKNEF